MTYYKLLVFWLIIVSALDSFAQEPDSIIVLKQVEIKAERILEKQTHTRSTQVIPKVALKTYSTNTLSDLLSKTTNITINQYGASGLSSVSMRGGNANHTAILWNGFNIQDPLNGGFDLSLSTVNLIDEIDINYGGNSALFGSGAMGGSIQLNNKAKYNSDFGVGFTQSIGSFGKRNSLFSISYGNKKLFLRTRVFYSYIKNDFEYKNYAKKNYPIDTLENAAIKQYGFLQEVSYKINSKNEINAQLWYQNNYSEIAPNMTVINGYATQYDEFLRTAVAYIRKGKKLDLEIRNGLFFTKLQFIKPEINLDANHSSLNNITEAIANYKITKYHSVLFGINNNFIKAESDNYNNAQKLNKTALFLSYKYSLNRKALFTANIRTEAVDTEFKPFTFGLKGEYFILKSLSINSSISKNYRTPSFNDLYWIGAYGKGNPDLKDEYGYSADLGANHRAAFKKLGIETNLSVYYSRLSNLIHWQPEGNTWTPKNKKLVDTKGVELRINSNYKLTKNTSVFLNASYTYTDSQLKEKADNESDNILNKQLIYIPFYQANGLIGLQYKKLRGDIIVKYVGQRYTTADNTNWLDKYIITDLSLNYTVNYKKVNGSIFFKANNIFNTYYMIREWFPTPLINYEIGININYN